MATTSLGSALGSIATLPNLDHIYKQQVDHVATTTTSTTTSLSSSSTVRNHPSVFLGNRVSYRSRSVQVAKGGHAVRCFSTDPSERVRGGSSSSSGRIIVTPFGPIFAPNYGSTGRSGSNARREWERRNQGEDERRRMRAQQQQRERERYNRAMVAKQQQEMMRMRQMIQEQMMMRGSRRSAESSKSSSDMALLRELEQRLRAASGNQGADQSSVDELVKEVEKRLRNAQGGGGAQPGSARENRGTTVYDFLNGWMKEWDKGVVEERERLQKQWQKSQPNSTPPPPAAAATDDDDDDDDLKEKKRPSEAQVYDPAELQRAEEEEESKKKKNAAETDRQEEVRTSDTDSTKAKVKNESKEAAMKHRQSDGTVVYLKNEANGSEVYLVGTSHVSQQSADEVREVIKRVRPDYVMVELDRKRYESMMKSQSVGARGRENPFTFVQQMVQTLANGNIGAMGKLVGIGLSGFYRLLATRGLQPGQEFKVAIEEGKNVGAKIVLGDQDIDLTMKHLGEQMSMQDAFQFFAQPMPQDVAQQMSGSSKAPKSTGDMFERLRDRKIVRRFNEEMEKGAPALTKVLLGERNEAMTKALRNLNGKVVAVVGLAHLDGMEQLWHEANHNFLTGKQ